MARTDVAPAAGLIRAGWTRAVAIAAGGATLLGLAGFLFSRLVHSAATYDEGVYLLSVGALRHGEQLGTQVFAAQPPGFYLLLRGIVAVAGDSVTDVRWGILAASVVVVAAVGFVGRALAGTLGGALSAALLVIAPPFALLCAASWGDLLPLALAVPALAIVARRSTPDWLVVASGALLAAGLAVKPTAVLVAPAYAAYLLLAPRRVRRLLDAAAGFAALGVALALAYLSDLGAIWDDAVAYHVRAAGGVESLGRVEAVEQVFSLRTPFSWLLLAGAAAALVARGRSAVVWLFPASALAFVLVHRPLFDHHLVVLPVALAAAAGTSLAAAARRLRPSGRALAPAALVVALMWMGGYVQQLHRLDAAFVPEDPAKVRAAAILARVTAPDAYVASDQSVVPVLAGRSVPGPLVDTSFVRFESGALTDAAVLRAVREWRVQAVVVGRAFAQRPKLLGELRSRFPRTARAGSILILHRP